MQNDHNQEIPGVRNILKYMTSSNRVESSKYQDSFTHLNEKLTRRTQTIVDEIFKKFGRVYQTKFWKDFEVVEKDEEKRKQKVIKKVNDCKLEWVDSDLKYYTADEIGKALDRAKHEHDWPPTLKQFLELCEFCAEYDSAEKAYQNVFKRPIKDLDLLTRVTVQEVGQFELQTLSAERMRPVFVKKYREVCLRKRKGEDLTKCFKPEPKSLPNLPATKDTEKKHMDQLKRKFNAD